MKVRTLSGWSALALVLGLGACQSPLQPPDAPPVVFDFAATGSEAAAGVNLVTPDHRWGADAPYGYDASVSGIRTYERTNLARSRAADMRSGHAMPALDFKATVEPGRWRINIWFDAGYEDSSTVAIRIGGKDFPLGWQAFNPPAEPRTSSQPQWRVFHYPVDLADGLLDLKVTAKNDSVRILKMALWPDRAQPETEEERAFYASLKAAGTYPAEGGLDSLMRLADARSSEPFFYHWNQMLALQHHAEEMDRLRGWQWGTDSTGLGIFTKYHQGIMDLDAILNQPDVKNDPLYERALLYRARFQYWLGREYGFRPDQMAGIQDFKTLYALHPNDDLLAMYNGKQIHHALPIDQYQWPSNTPQWARQQYEALERLRSIAHWWVSIQAPNGEFGGKLGDDVELLRWWPILILSGDTLAEHGWKTLADGIWASDEIAGGYASKVSDVEHASEFISDTAPMMAIYSDDPEYRNRLRGSAEYFKGFWTGTSDHGNRMFRSSWFSSTELETEPPKDRDVKLNTRATKAVRFLARFEPQPALVRALSEWSATWRAAALRTDKGKPLGLFPASLRYPDEVFNGDEPTWYEANMYWSYFDWRGGGTMYDQLLFTWQLTGDESLLEPMFRTIELIEANHGGDRNAERGSEAWAAHRIANGDGFWNVAAQWRLRTGDTRYDSLFQAYATPYMKYRLTGDASHLSEGLEPTLDIVRHNYPLLTNECLVTDRVYATADETLRGMITGDETPENSSPNMMVSWENTENQMAMLVSGTGQDFVQAEVYNFADRGLAPSMRVFSLPAGSYTLSITPEGGPEATSQVRVQGAGSRIALQIPPRVPVTVRLRKS